jgi:hypothetical protein
VLRKGWWPVGHLAIRERGRCEGGCKRSREREVGGGKPSPSRVSSERKVVVEESGKPSLSRISSEGEVMVGASDGGRWAISRFERERERGGGGRKGRISREPEVVGRNPPPSHVSSKRGGSGGRKEWWMVGVSRFERGRVGEVQVGARRGFRGGESWRVGNPPHLTFRARGVYTLRRHREVVCT